VARVRRRSARAGVGGGRTAWPGRAALAGRGRRGAAARLRRREYATREGPLPRRDFAARRGGRHPAPHVRLVDARGRVLDTRELRGRPYAVTFLYTHCPDVCPLIGAELRAALERLGRDAGRVAVVAVSVDPNGDTPRAVRAWLRQHREPPNFHYLIGSRSQLAPVWRAYMVAPLSRGSESAHTASIWLVDARGRRRALMSAGRLDPADISHDLLLLIREAGVADTAKPRTP
jgi:protein SCO1